MHNFPFFHALFCRAATASTKFQMLAAVLGMALGTGWVSILFWNAWVQTGLLRYADSNLPMLNTPDSYFFLYNTQEMLRMGLSFNSESSLSTMLALIHKAVWLPPEVTGFWLPAVLAVANGLCFALWGRLFRLPPFLVGLTALLGSLLPVWTARVRIGTLDTDAGIFLLWGLCLWLAACLTLPRMSLTTWKKGSCCFAFFLCATVLGWFWNPGLLLLPLAIWIWGLTWNWAASHGERLARITVACALPAASLLMLFLSETFFSASILSVRDSILSRMEMVLNPHNDIIFQSIAELGGLDLTSWLTGLGGNAAGGGLVLLAVLCMALRHPRETLLLIPSLLMSGLAFFSNRFQFFAMLPVALAVGMLPLTLPVLLRRLRIGVGRFPRLAAQTTAVCLLALVLWNEGNHQWRDRGGVFLTQGEDQIGLALQDAINAKPFGEPKALFHWWDEGYYLRYRTGLHPFFDGSTQNPLSAFLAAMPFVTDNTTLSRRWIRYFALHGANQGQEGWQSLVQAWGSQDIALRELLSLFALPDEEIDARLEKWPEIPGLFSQVSTRDWLFPQGAVFLFLPVRFLTISPWWMAMGSGLRPGSVLNHMERFPHAALTFDPQSNQVRLPDDIVRKGYTQAGGLFLCSPEQPFAAPWGGDRAEPLIVAAAHSPWGYLINKVLARSIGFRLLAPSWEELPGFRLIAANYGTAGAWEILP